MIIVAGGDSFVWGSELADCLHAGPEGYSKNTFPALLAESYVCVAYPGIGNREIANRVREYLVCAKSPDLVLVCWTWPSRDNELDSDFHINSLQKHLEELNVSYLFTCADNCVVTGNLDYTNWFMFPPATEPWNTIEPRGFYQWAVENKYSCGPDRHPLEHAHIEAAKLMQEKINELAKKPLQQNPTRDSLSQEVERAS